MIRFALIGLLACAACAVDHDPVQPAGDAGEDSAGPDLHLDLISFFVEIERGTRMSCPCHVRRGEYPSTEACMESVSFKDGWQECVMGVALPNSRQMGEALHCALDQLREQNDCVEPSECPDDALPECRVENMQCPKLDTSLITHVIEACHDAIMLWH